MVVKVNNVACKTLLDSGEGSYYAYSAILKKWNIQPVRKETKLMELMMHAIVAKIDMF